MPTASSILWRINSLREISDIYKWDPVNQGEKYHEELFYFLPFITKKFTHYPTNKKPHECGIKMQIDYLFKNGRNSLFPVKTPKGFDQSEND